MAPISSSLPTVRSTRDSLSDRFGLYKTSPGVSTVGLRSLRKKYSSAEPITIAENNSNSILECEPLHILEGNLVDASGRIRVLRGINADASMKIPTTPFMPSYEGESCDSENVFFDGDNVSFVGRPFPLETAESHLIRIKSLGYNTIRYLICWEAIEHAGPGIYDEEFVDYTIEILRIINNVGGLYVFLEPHQDVWSRYCGGSGAPMWTLYAAGLQPTRFAACEAAVLHNNDKFDMLERNDPQHYPKMIWASNYKRLASFTMFTLFFAGATYFPHLKINGMNIQNYLQSHHLDSFHHLWEAVVKNLPEMIKNGSLLGCESMNEPNCGLVGSPNLSLIPGSQQLRVGTTPTVFQCLMLGMGFPVEVDNFKITVTGPQKDGRVLVDPRGQRAWLLPHEAEIIDAKYGWKRSGWDLGKCIYSGVKIWRWQDTDLDKLSMLSQNSRHSFSLTKCELLKPNYFNEVSARVSFNVPDEKLPVTIDTKFFVNHFFVDYYVKFKDMVRSVEPNAFVFMQPLVLEEPPLLKNDPRNIVDNKTIYCPHYYDGMSLMFKSWNYRYNVDTLGIMRGRYINPVLGIVFGERAIRNCLRKQFVEIKEEGRAFLGNIPVLMSETGMPFDMDGKRAYDDCRYTSQTSALDALSYALEGSGMHFTYWCYCSINSHKWGDRWNNEDFSFWSPDDRDLTVELSDNYNAVSSSRLSATSSSNTRRNSLTPSLKSVRAAQEESGAVGILRTKLAYHKSRILSPLLKRGFFQGCCPEYDEDDLTLPDDSSLISTSTENLRYRHIKQCYPSPDGIRAVSAVMRPSVLATVGTMKYSEFDMKLSKFTLTVVFNKQIHPQSRLADFPTIIYVPKWHFPYLNYNDIYLNVGFVKYNETLEYLEWYHFDESESEGCSSSENNIYPTEHTIVLKNNSGKLEDIRPRDYYSLPNECPIS